MKLSGTRQSQIDELKRLKAICYLRNNPAKENISRNENSERGKSMPQHMKKLKSQISNWQEYEIKAKKLEENFQRFARDFKYPKKISNTLNQSEIIDPFNNSLNISNTEIHNKTITNYDNSIIETENSPIKRIINNLMNKPQNLIWEEMQKFYEKIFLGLKSLAITQSQEHEIKAAQHENKISFEKLCFSDCNPSTRNTIIKTQFGEIIENFNKITDKIKLIASKSFQNYKLRDIKSVFSAIFDGFLHMILTFILQFFNSCILSVKLNIGFTKMQTIYEKIYFDNKISALGKIRQNANFLLRQRKEKSLINFLQTKIPKFQFGNIKMLENSLFKWKYGIKTMKISETQKLLDFYNKLLNCINSKNPWSEFNFLLNNYLTKHCVLEYCDFIRFDKNTNEFIYNIPETQLFTDKLENSSEKSKKIQEIKYSFSSMSGIISSITKQIIKNQKLFSDSQYYTSEPVEIRNIFEDTRLNKIYDFPYIQNCEKLYENGLFLLAIPIIDNKNGNFNGIIRIYKKSEIKNIDKNILNFINEICEFIKGIYENFNKIIVARQEILNKNNEIIKRYEKLQESSKFYKNCIWENLRLILETENFEEIYQNIEKCAKNLFFADQISILEIENETNIIKNMRNPYETLNDFYALETIRKNKILENNMKNKQILYIPIKNIDKNITNKFIIYAERLDNENKWSEEINEDLLEIIYFLFPIFIQRIAGLNELNEFNQNANYQINLHMKNIASFQIFNLLNKKYKEKLSNGITNISKYCIFQYKNFTPNQILLPKIIQVLSKILQRNFNEFRKNSNINSHKIFIMKNAIKIMQNQSLILLRNYFIKYQRKTQEINQKLSLVRITEKFAPKIKNTKISIILLKHMQNYNITLKKYFSKWSKNAKNMLEIMQKRKKSIQDFTILFTKKFMRNSMNFFIQKISKISGQNSAKFKILKYLINKHIFIVKKLNFSKLRTKISQISLLQKSQQNAIIFMNAKIHKIILLKLGVFINRWRSQIISDAKNERSKCLEMTEKCKTTELLHDFSSKTFSMIEQIIDISYSCNNIEDLLTNTIFLEIISHLRLYFKNKFSSSEVLLTISLPAFTKNCFYLLQTKSENIASPISIPNSIQTYENISIPENLSFIKINEPDPFLSQIGATRSILKFQNLTKSDSLFSSVILRKVRSYKSGLILPILQNGNLLGTLEFYKKELAGYNEKEEILIKENCDEIMSKFYAVTNTALSNIMRKIEKLQIDRQNSILFDSFISQISKTNTLSSIINKMALIATKLLNSDKSLIILTQDDEINNKKLAYFYSFSDAHVYSFDFSGTFIETIVSTGETIIFPTEEDIKQNNLKAQSINEEEFNQIKYIPIMGNTEKTQCVLELCYKNVQHSVPESEKINELTQIFIETLSKEIEQFMHKISFFTQRISNILIKHAEKLSANSFSKWKKLVECLKKHENTISAAQEKLNVEKHLAEIMGVNSEYQKEISQNEEEINKIAKSVKMHNEKISELENEQQNLEVEKNAKLKFLASALLFNQMETYNSKVSKLHNSWENWTNRLIVYKSKITAQKETEKILEMHKKSEKKAAMVFMMKTMKKICMNKIGLIFGCIKEFHN